MHAKTVLRLQVWHLSPIVVLVVVVKTDCVCYDCRPQKCDHK